MTKLEKSTVEEIRARFDKNVGRFSDLQSGQAATINAPLSMELVAKVAAELLAQSAFASTRDNASRWISQRPHVVDVGCGAGNYTLKLLESAPDLDCTLIDLSAPMLSRAAERVCAATAGKVTTIQSDIRELELAPANCDIILAAAVLHHLRGEKEWRAVFKKFHDALRPDGSVWIVDLVEHSTRAVQQIM